MPISPEEDAFVPPAVRKQLEEAEARLAASQRSGGDLDANAEPVEPAVDPGFDPGADVAQVDNDLDLDIAQEPRQRREDWKHKFQVLKGKYDAEIPDLNSRLMVLGATLEQQTAVIEDLQAKLQAPVASASQPASASVPAKELDETEYEGYGENILKLVRGFNALLRAQSAPAPASQMSADLDGRVKRIEAQVVRTAEEQYFDALDKAVPDWKVLNNDAKFLAWLGHPDTITEIPRINVIKRAASNFNARQVANIFNVYKKEAGLVTRPTPKKKDISAEVSVVPSGTGAEGDADLQARSAEKYAGREEFSKAKDAFIKGRIKEADFNKISNKFQAAIRDGKVKG